MEKSMNIYTFVSIWINRAISRISKIIRVAIFSVVSLLFVASIAESAILSAANLSTARMMHSSTPLPNGKVLLAGGKSDADAYSEPLSSVEIYDPSAKKWTAASDLILPRYRHTATLLPNGKVLVAGGAPANYASAEIYDSSSNSWSLAAPSPFGLSEHTATLLHDGKVLVVGGGGSAIYDPQQNVWLTITAPNMTKYRNGHSATLLKNGRVLIVGGYNANYDSLSTAEIYDPTTNSWSAAGRLATIRYLHTATLLPNGKVLVHGGNYGYWANVRTAEMYDPATNAWIVVATLEYGVRMATATLLPSGEVLIAGGIEDTECFPTSSRGWIFDYQRNTFTPVSLSDLSMHTATLLPDGKVLFAGGGNTTKSTLGTNYACLYDNYSGSWSPSEDMSDARQAHTATILTTGEVLVAGGISNGATLASSEIYNESDGTWRTTGRLAIPRESPTATLLASGKVLVVGGKSGATSLASAERYDQSTNSWSTAGSLGTARVYHSATLLPNGKVLAVGGINKGKNVTTAEIYNSSTNSWTAAKSPASARANHTATLLQNGKVLVVGGNNGSTYLATAEIYDPAANIWTAAGPLATGRSGHSATLLPNGRVLVTGGRNGTGYLASAEIYDSAKNSWYVITPLTTARSNHSASITLNGKVLVVGGVNSSGAVSSVEILDANDSISDWTYWSSGGTLATPRYLHTATVLDSGKVLIAGGAGGSGSLATGELFTPGYFDESRRPAMTSVSTASGAAQISITGAGLLGDSECSSGSMGSSPSNFPLLLLQRVDNNQSVFLGPDPLKQVTDTSLTSQTLTDLYLSAGHYRVTVIVNGVPSVSQIVNIAPVLATNPGSVYFGNTAVGSTASASTVTVTNNGSGIVGLTGILIYGEDASQFAVAPGGTCGASLSPGQSCQILVTFSPTSAKEMNATLRIKTNDVNEAYDVQLHGTGVPLTYTMTLALTGTGSGSVAVQPSPPGVLCTSSCSESFNDGTLVTLNPSANADSVFAGWSACDAVIGAACQLRINENRTVSATFDTASSGIIHAISVKDITPMSATITWDTDLPATSRIDYGPTGYGSSSTDTSFTTTHSVSLSGLSPGTSYHFKVTSVTETGLLTSSADNLFTTPLFSAKTVMDVANVAVMDAAGAYDAILADGSINTVPRQLIAKEFIARHGDTYDFLVIATNFTFDMPEADAGGFYLGVKNDTQGIGLPLFDDSALFGSQGKLQGTIDLGNISAVSANPLDATFEGVINTLGHEVTHRWGAYVRYRNAAGTTSTALLGKDGGHWSYLLDTSGSLVYGNAWLDTGNGTYTSTAARSIYSALDLYLMGLYDKTQVPPMLLIQNAAIDPAQLPQPAATVTGTPALVTIDDIVAVEGDRIPTAAEAQKAFKVGFVLLTAAGTSAGEDAAKLETIRNTWAGRFAALTGGKAKIADVAPSLSIIITSPVNGSTVAGTATTVEGMVINTAGNETGIVVNGFAATVSGNRFVLNNLPLEAGGNVIIASAIDSSGLTATTAATVTSEIGRAHV